MSKILDLIQRQEIEMIDGYPTGNVYIGLTFEELAELEKELKALEIIKKYPCCSLQRYIGFNELVKNGYELTQEHLFSHDILCSVEEYNIVIGVLLNEIH